MDYDIGLICRACGAVTIFKRDAPRPRRCARCLDLDGALGQEARERPTRPGLRSGHAEAKDLEWLE